VSVDGKRGRKKRQCRKKRSRRRQQTHPSLHSQKTVLLAQDPQEAVLTRSNEEVVQFGLWRRHKRRFEDGIFEWREVGREGPRLDVAPLWRLPVEDSVYLTVVEECRRVLSRCKGSVRCQGRRSREEKGRTLT
jgi:hypothetical protein